VNYYIEGEAITFTITDPSPGVHREGIKHQLMLSTAPTDNTTIMLTDSELIELDDVICNRLGAIEEAADN
jgi:hypothetical protein